jgi:hypothetical protein
VQNLTKAAESRVIDQPEQGAALIDALEAVLRPLMPLFLNYGVTHSDLSRMVGRVFVYAIAEQLKAQGRPTTVARLAIMTGINRGLVEKCLEEREGAARRRQFNASAMNTPAIVLATWHDDSRFGTPYGAPLDLDLDLKARRSFHSLVEAAAPGMDWEAVLDQLQAAGCVEVINEQFARCTSRTFISSGIKTEHIARIGEVLGGLASTLTHNLLLEEGQVGYLERKVESEFQLSLEGQRRLRQQLESVAGPFLEQLDRWFTSEQSQLQDKSGRRFAVSLFMHEVSDESTVAPAKRAAG